MPGRSPRKARQLADALAATELVLAREQHLSQLDGLAAAAAHELGTPLSTISVVAKELERAHRAELAARRRRQAAARAGAALPRHPRQAHRAVRRRRAVRPHAADRADRGGGGAASQFRRRHRRRCCPATAAPSRSARATRRSSTASAICSRTRSISRASASRSPRTGARTTSTVTISDDGPGFAPEIMGRIGEPYVTSRRRQPMNAARKPRGLGLGFFIAKTLLERSGATLAFRQPRPPGAWRDRAACAGARSDFERPLALAAA